MKRDWDRRAAEMATYLSAHHFDEHRGVVEGPAPGHAVLFGNDGYSQDPRARLAVELVREGLGRIEFDELGFGLAPPDRYTWAMVVAVDPRDPVVQRYLLDLVRKSWTAANRGVRGRARDRCFRLRIAAGTGAAEDLARDDRAPAHLRESSARVLPAGDGPALLSVVGARPAAGCPVARRAVSSSRNRRTEAPPYGPGGLASSAGRPRRRVPGATGQERVERSGHQKTGADNERVRAGAPVAGGSARRSRR
jgi:hypothetical protein